MDQTTRPVITTDDIKNTVNKWEQERNEKYSEDKKLVVLYVGGAGVGKSSCIKVMCNITDKKHLEQLNITDRGQSGTINTNVYNSQYITAIDICGKRQDQSKEEYMNYISSVLKEHRGVVFIIGVVEALGDRCGDLDVLVESLQIICKEWEKPFIILMNKYDKVEILGKSDQFNARKKYMEEKCGEIQSNFTWTLMGNKTFSQGIFPVSADANLEPEFKCTKCLEKRNYSTTHEIDDFPDNTIKTIYLTRAYHCLECNIITIIRRVLTEEEMTKINSYAAKKKNAIIIEAEPISKNLGPRDPAFQAILNLSDDIIGAALLKSICTEISERIAGTTVLIRREAKKIYGLSDAIEHDKNLCKSIAETFGLTETALIHGNYETSRWNDVKITDKVMSFFRKYVTGSNRQLSLYIAAWGIYYARKFCCIASTITESYEKHRKMLYETSRTSNPSETSTENFYTILADECTRKCTIYNDNKQLEYYYFILQYGLEEALEKYILKDDATEPNANPEETYASPNLGKN